MSHPAKPYRPPIFFALGATAWSALLIPMAIWLPAISVRDETIAVSSTSNGGTTTFVPSGPHRVPQHSFVHDYGYEVLWRVAVPLLVALVVLWLLAIAGRRTGGHALGAAWFLSGLLMLAAFIGFVTFFIGIYVLPTGALLLAACLSAHTGRQLAIRPIPIGWPPPTPS